MNKPTIEKTIKTARKLLEKSVDLGKIRSCMIKDGFSEQQVKVMLLWAKHGIKNVKEAIPVRQERTPESA